MVAGWLAIPTKQFNFQLLKVTSELTARITALETDVAAAGEQLEQAQAAEQDAAREASAALTRLAAAEARASTLQQAHDALLQRIVPETPPRNEPRADRTSGGED